MGHRFVDARVIRDRMDAKDARMQREQAKATQRYCGPCDKWVPARQTTCAACGAVTDKQERG